ncbi:MAG: trypsin-like serine protease, partial [Tannerella sp.]|nr:trypsin-like serine protease [Tannerella sp.]
INNIAYIYRSLNEITNDLTCYINVNCSEGDNWQSQKKGVVRLLIQDGLNWGLCSGSLINNVREDKTPFILTANHCVSGTAGQVFSTMKFNFFMESTSTDCYIQTESSPTTKTITGAKLIATTPINGSSDGTLLELSRPIPEAWEVYYNGWDARGIAATSGVSIHHPNGYVKKISTFTNPLVSAGNLNMEGGEITGANAHWRVQWSPTANGRSVTYGGSSGSPIFNQDGLIVGTLTGGGSFCNNPTAYDYYGKFSYHWDQHTDAQQHFKAYLDPDNTNTLVLNGYDPHEILNLGEPEALAASDITSFSFTANWEALENANKYYLDVYQKQEGGALEYLDGFERKDVGNTLSYTVTGLEPETVYWYVVRGGVHSQVFDPSNEIKVTTADYSAITTPQTENKFTLRMDNENIYIHTDIAGNTPVVVYNLLGQVVISRSLQQQDMLISKKGFSGVYFIKIGTETYKVLLK